LVANLGFGICFKWLVLNSVAQKLPALLFHLKYFCFEDVSFVDGYGLAFLLVLIKCSPNLEKIKLEVNSIFISRILLVLIIMPEYTDKNDKLSCRLIGIMMVMRNTLLYGMDIQMFGWSI
jgi:hypothetical protein